MVSGDAVIKKNGEDSEVIPAFRFGVLQGEKLRAVDDIKQSFTNRATRVLTPINLPTWDHSASMIKLFMKPTN